MFNKVLIANRGEIAVRIIRGCRELGIKTVAIFSEADRDALHVEMADEAICIGPAKATDSYLNMHSVLSAAIVSGAEAIHPGFGFLAENSMFAEMCEECQIKFIGPMPKTIDSMGNKINARKLMIEACVPVIPGSEGEISTLKEAKTIADEVGYPIMLKAAAGGGGKGIRKVLEESELEKQFQSAQQEALATFGNGQMYIEKVIYPARHIEVQILGDHYGNIIHLGERDCSLQRSNQKVLEEAPAFGLSNELREMMGEAALKAAQAVNYENAGTIEFLVDLDNNFYFMEMNTRIQVEHGVTEMITGIDLMKEQISVAAGEELSFTQEDVKVNGCALECRINAEDPSMNFVPCPGKVENYLAPGGIGLRIDSAVYPGYVISPFYDSMVSKVIAWGRNREEAISRMKRALNEFTIEGVKTTIPFHKKLMDNETFITGNFNTKFLEIEKDLF